MPMHYWQDKPVLAGRDEQEGGTWMGLSRSGGRFAAVTNFRDSFFKESGFNVKANDKESRPKSRGALVTDFLCSEASAQSWADILVGEMGLYGGFNLLIYDGEQLLYLNNFNNEVRSLEPGIYALSNHLLDCPWPKVDFARQQLTQALSQHNVSKCDDEDHQISVEIPEASDLLSLLTLEKNHTFPDHLLPDTGIPANLEKLVSSAFIVSEDFNYGTRSSTSLVLSSSGCSVGEQTFDNKGVATHREIYEFSF